MIKIKKSPTNNNKDWSKTTEEELLLSSEMHISDISQGMKFFISLMENSAINHDKDKITDIKWYLHDFQTNFKENTWFQNHKRVNRHHLTDKSGIPEDVNVIDILDHIVDCVMACKARGGEFKDITLSNDVVQKAIQNTAELLLNNVQVQD